VVSLGSISKTIPGGTQTVNGVPGTSASYFLLSASSAGVETLQLFAPSGAPLSLASGFRVAILRVQ